MKPLVSIWILYGIHSVFLSILFIIIFGVNKRFKYSFYRIVQCDLFMNLLCHFNTWPIRLAQLRDTGYLFEFASSPDWSGVRRFFGFTESFFFHSQSSSIILLCVYRLSLLRNHRVNRFWMKYAVPVYILISVYSIGVTLPISNTFHAATYNETLKYFVGTEITPEEYFVASKYLLLFTSFYFIVITVLGIVTMLKLQSKFADNGNDERTKSMMRRMTIIVAINILVYLSVIIFEVMAGKIFPDMSHDDKISMMVTISDLLSFSMPYTLLFCDKNVQEFMLRKKLQVIVNDQNQPSPPREFT